MASAKTIVPTPTEPPSSQPIARTTISMTVRARRIGQPVAAFSPVISPSRGPGPSPEPR
jgi:hypothetical protein